MLLCLWIKTHVHCQPPPYEFISTNEPVFGAEQRGLPGDTHEFKYNIEAGRQECLYQRIKSGANLHIAFEVRYEYRRKYIFYKRTTIKKLRSTGES